ncbi:hypothetical protein [Nocardioides mangrovi]|uniref:DUF4229 domain-containing protein n=1 Tax=Nocardioides mangrovi TaxID=2874580 RepID=A0ABS7UKC1_9ACTN|nr:hypothetical protein [Nocardioides mangrovi]MBZ5741200.1 hypothetical protein [Nocardioides mangrovi]
MLITLLGVLVGILAVFVVLTVAYRVVRYAVRDGIVDAQRRIDAERDRAQARSSEPTTPR